MHAFFDSACYLTGKTFGKNKILINISPNKTYEGLFGGIFLTNLVCFIFILILIYQKLTTIYLFFLI